MGHQKGFESGPVGLLIIIKGYEGSGADRREFPEDQELKEIRGKSKPDHRKDEK